MMGSDDASQSCSLEELTGDLESPADGCTAVVWFPFVAIAARVRLQQICEESVFGDRRRVVDLADVVECGQIWTEAAVDAKAAISNDCGDR
jgi:hypothetical protein